MNEQKQIEEMAKVIETTAQIARDAHCGYPSPTMYAKDLYWHGYRRQIEGEWHTIADHKISIVTECTACKKTFWFMKKGQLNIDRMPYCPNCGAKMKGGAEK